MSGTRAPLGLPPGPVTIAASKGGRGHLGQPAASRACARPRTNPEEAGTRRRPGPTVRVIARSGGSPAGRCTETASRGPGDSEDERGLAGRGQTGVRSGRRGQPASDRLAGMTSLRRPRRQPTVADVLKPDLKPMGFRKSLGTGRRRRGDYRGVTFQSPQFNVTLTCASPSDRGFFVALGHPVPNAPGAWGVAVSRRLSGLRRS